MTTITQLRHASIGVPIGRHGTWFFPIYVHQPTTSAATGVTTSTDDLVVTEVDGGVVPRLRVHNPGPVPVLVTEGETLVGGRQNRVLNVSILVPGGATLDVPVSCVEQGRWNTGNEFRRANWKATRRVRREMVEGLHASLRTSGRKQADQERVWSAVRSELDRFESHSDTVALNSILEQDYRPTYPATHELIQRGPLPGQCGVVIARGSRIVAAEIFATPELLAAAWASIVSSQMLEADDRPGAPSTTRALQFLHRLAEARTRVEPGVGLGQEVHLTTRSSVGQALVWDDIIVHASAFALAA